MLQLATLLSLCYPTDGPTVKRHFRLLTACCAAQETLSLQYLYLELAGSN